MASVVASLFGPTPEQLASQRAEQDAILSQNAARISPYYGAGYGIGMALGRGAEALFGIQDPALQKATLVQQTLQQVNKSLTPEEKANPALLYGRLGSAFADAGLADEAMLAQEKGQQLGLEYDTKQANLIKAKQETEIRAKQIADEANAQATLQDILKNKPDATTEDIVTALSPYLSVEKLVPMIQSSADKAAYRQTMLDQAKLGLEGRLETLRMQGATQLQIKQMEIQGRKEIEALKASLNPSGGAKSSVYERGYANNFVTSTAELVPASLNLNVLTSGGTSPVTAGIFTNLKGTGVLSATGAALGTSMTSAESGQYESIMLPVIQNIATMQNAGRRTTINQTENLKSALIAKPGQPYIVQVQKMGELRQIAEAAAEAAKTNPAMSEEQLAAIEGNIARVRQSIPFTGTDVAKYSQFSKKNPTVKFVDWLKVNGSDKEAFGGGKVEVRRGIVKAEGPNKGKTVVEYSDGSREYK